MRHLFAAFAALLILASPAASTTIALDMTDAVGKKRGGPFPDWALASDWIGEPGASLYRTKEAGFQIEALATDSIFGVEGNSRSIPLGNLTAVWYTYSGLQIERYRFTRPDRQAFSLEAIDFGSSVSEMFLSVERPGDPDYVAQFEPGTEEHWRAREGTALSNLIAYRNVYLVGTTADGQEIERVVASFGEEIPHLGYGYRAIGMSFGPLSVAFSGLTNLVSLEIVSRSGGFYADTPAEIAAALPDVCLPSTLAAAPPELELDAICLGKPLTTGRYAGLSDITMSLFQFGSTDNGSVTTIESMTFEVAQIPTPASWLALGGGLIALGSLRSSRRITSRQPDRGSAQAPGA